MSDTINIFEVAARKKYRFDSVRGSLTAENLFDLPLVSGTGFDLDTLARAVNGELKELTEGSFVDVKPDPRKKDLEHKLDLLKAVIAFKQESLKAAERRRDNANARAKILDAINRKKDDALSQASIEDLEKQLAALGD